MQRKSIVLSGEESVLRQVARLLAGQYIIHQTRNPVQAISRLQQERDVHAFLTEQTTSAGEGVDLLKSARDIRPHVRRVLLTPFGDLSTIVEGLHSGVIQHLVQLPIREAELFAAVGPPTLQSASPTHQVCA